MASLIGKTVTVGNRQCRIVGETPTTVMVREPGRRGRTAEMQKSILQPLSPADAKLLRRSSSWRRHLTRQRIAIAVGVLLIAAAAIAVVLGTR